MRRAPDSRIGGQKPLDGSFRSTLRQQCPESFALVSTYIVLVGIILLIRPMRGRVFENVADSGQRKLWWHSILPH